MARIRMAVQKRTRQIMMKVIHKTADDLADEAAGDDRLVAWLLARKIRTRLPGEKITLLDAAVKKAGISDREPPYLVSAKSRVEKAIEAYDLANDPSESKNLADKFPDKVTEFTEAMISARDEPETEKFRFWKYE